LGNVQVLLAPQHPEHEVASQAQVPLLVHRCPGSHAARLPHRHCPASQVLVVVALQTVQTPPLPPQVGKTSFGWHTPLRQQVAQLEGPQLEQEPPPQEAPVGQTWQAIPL
jgi:hypothetical protein